MSRCGTDSAAIACRHFSVLQATAVAAQCAAIETKRWRRSYRRTGEQRWVHYTADRCEPAIMRANIKANSVDRMRTREPQATEAHRLC